MQRVCIKVFLEFFRTGDDDAGLPPIKAIVCDTGAVNIFFFFTFLSASCVYARSILFLLLETTSSSLSSSSSSSSCEIIIRERAMRKQKPNKNKIHTKQKNSALLIICHKTTDN